MLQAVKHTQYKGGKLITKGMPHTVKREIMNSRGPSSYATSPIIREMAREDMSVRKTWKEIRVNAGRWVKSSEFIGPTTPGTYVIEERTCTNVVDIKIKSGGKRGQKMRYRLHQVNDLGRENERWIVLSCYAHLKSVYQRITKLRAHYLHQRMYRERLHVPTFFIEFLKSDSKDLNAKKNTFVRAFELLPCGQVDMFRWMHSGMSSSTYYRRDYTLMPSSMVKHKKKRKTYASGSQSNTAPPWAH